MTARRLLIGKNESDMKHSGKIVSQATHGNAFSVGHLDSKASLWAKKRGVGDANIAAAYWWRAYTAVVEGGS